MLCLFSIPLSFLSIGWSLRTGLGVSSNASLSTFNCALSTCSGKGRCALLTDRLLASGGHSHGVIHIGVDLLAGIALALIAALEVLKVILENF